MASAIGPGDFVECVDASPLRGGDRLFGPSGLTECAVYIVAAIAPVPPGWRNQGALEVILREVQNPFGGGFCPSRFRPVYRPSADLIESLKQPAPEAVRELIGEDA